VKVTSLSFLWYQWLSKTSSVPRTSLQKIFQEIDVQGDGKLNYENFLEGVSHGAFHSHGCTPIAGWFMFIMEHAKIKLMILRYPPF